MKGEASLFRQQQDTEFEEFNIQLEKEQQDFFQKQEGTTRIHAGAKKKVHGLRKKAR